MDGEEGGEASGTRLGWSTKQRARWTCTGRRPDHASYRPTDLGEGGHDDSTTGAVVRHADCRMAGCRRTLQAEAGGGGAINTSQLPEDTGDKGVGVGESAAKRSTTSEV